MLVVLAARIQHVYSRRALAPGQHQGLARQRHHAHATASCPGRRLQLPGPAAALVPAQPAIGEPAIGEQFKPSGVRLTAKSRNDSGQTGCGIQARMQRRKIVVYQARSRSLRQYRTRVLETRIQSVIVCQYHDAYGLSLPLSSLLASPSQRLSSS